VHAGRSVARWLAPTLLDCVLISLLVWQFAAGGRWITLLADGDTGWHIRTGEYILDERQWPRQDLFSFSKPGDPWFAWEWLADVAFAVTFRAAGLSGLAVLAALAIVLAALILFRRMLRLGANTFIAMIVLMLALGAASIHFLARPHVFTLLAWSLSWSLIERDRAQPGRTVWWLVPLTLVWVNVHGGFVALLASLGLWTVALAVECWLEGARRLPDFRPALRYASLVATCAAVSLVNPYGWRLHAHIAAYLRSEWIRRVVDEFQSPKFRSEYSLYFELLLFAALMAAPAFLKRRRLAEPALALFWGHAALVSARHVPLFVLLAGPWVAAEASLLWRRWASRAGPRSVPAILDSVSEDLRAGFARLSPWAAVGIAVVLLATPHESVAAGLPGPEVSGRDCLAPCRLAPRDPRVHLGSVGRLPDLSLLSSPEGLFRRSQRFYGSRLGDEYLKIVQGKTGWRESLDRWGFHYALIPEEWPLAGLLGCSGEWELVERKGPAVLYRRVGMEAALKKSPRQAEL
jgi:hypothetical protein